MTEVITHSGAAVSVAYRIKDESANKVLQPGWWALVRQGGDPDPLKYPVGALIVIERERDGLTERSVRRVARRTQTACELACHSTVKRYKRDRVCIPTTGETVMVVGLVVGGSFDIEKVT